MVVNFPSQLKKWAKRNLIRASRILHVREEKGRKFLQIKSTSIKLIRAAIVSFLCSPPHNKTFSIVADAAFTEANKVLDAFVKDLRKTGKIAGIVHKKPIFKEQMKRLFDSGELGPAWIPHNYRGRPGCISAAFL